MFLITPEGLQLHGSVSFLCDRFLRLTNWQKFCGSIPHAHNLFKRCNVPLNSGLGPKGVTGVLFREVQHNRHRKSSMNDHSILIALTRGVVLDLDFRDWIAKKTSCNVESSLCKSISLYEERGSQTILEERCYGTK